MATSKDGKPAGDSSDDEYDEVLQTFSAFNVATDSKKDPNKLTSKACGKMATECLKAKFGKYDVVNRCDASVFPHVKPKTERDMPLTKENVKKFCYKLGHEMAKSKHNDQTMKEDDERSKACRHEIKKCIKEKKPGSTGTKAVKTGAVDRLTDTSKYTGAHKERFDKSGKGKGIDGREERHANDGYVGAYKNKDTYDKKKK